MLLGQHEKGHNGAVPLLPLRVTLGSALASSLTVWGFAVAQPLYDLLGRRPEFLVAHGVTPVQLAGLTLLISLIAPALLAGLIGLTGKLSPLASSLLLLGWIGLGTSAIALPILASVEPLDGWAGVALAAAAGVAAAAAYLCIERARSIASWMAWGVLVFPLWLIVQAPLGGLDSASGGAAISQPRAAKPIPVVMLLLDELPLLSLLDRNNEIDASLFPNLAEFAGRAHWYRNAIAAGPYTNVAIPAILTGSDQADPKRSTSFRTQPENLFNLLGESHQIIARESVTQLCPPSLCAGSSGGGAGVDLALLASDLAVIQAHLLLPSSFRGGLPDIGDRWKGFATEPLPELDAADLASGPDRAAALSKVLRRGERVVRDFDQFHSHLTSRLSRAPSGPSADARAPFLYLHLMLPHMPWRFLPSGRSYFAYQDAPRGLLRRDKSGRRSWGNDEWLIVQAQQRHLLQVAYADKLVGSFLARLKEIGIFESALIMIAADHGAAFVAGQSRRALDADNMSDILLVPLLVKLPGQQTGTVVDEPVSTLDWLPTLASVVGVPIPWPVDGRSLLGPPRPAGASFPVRSGSRATLSRAELERMLADRDERVAQKVRVFGQRAGLPGLFQIGEHAALIGRRVSEFAQARTPPRWIARVPVEDHFADLDRAASIVPALIDGRITGRGRSQTQASLAISVSGRIEAVTRTYGQQGGFTALLPEAAFLRGPAELGIHRIVSRAGSIELAPIEVVSDRPVSPSETRN